MQGSYLCHHNQANEKTDDTDDEQQKFTPMADLEEAGVQIRNGCCKSLQAHELKHKDRFYSINQEMQTGGDKTQKELSVCSYWATLNLTSKLYPLMQYFQKSAVLV